LKRAVKLNSHSGEGSMTALAFEKDNKKTKKFKVFKK
jgi:hypothetical protein